MPSKEENVTEAMRKRALSAYKVVSPHVKNNKFMICIICGVTIGLISGISLRTHVKNDTISVLAYPGELFMRALKLLVLPFLISLLIVGSATLDIQKNKKIAARTLIYFVATSVLNVFLGLSLGLIARPGESVVKSNLTRANNNIAQRINMLDGFLDMGRNVIPDNIFQATFQQTQTMYEEVKVKDDFGTFTTVAKKKVQYRDGTNTLGIIVFCLVFGCVLGTLEESKRKVIVEFFSSSYAVLAKILAAVIWCTPVCVASIICGKILTVDDLGQTFQQVGVFVVATIGGFLLYQLALVQLIYYFIVKKNPYQYYKNFGPVLATAFATASKSATLPVAFKVLEDDVKMNTKITRFVMPIGTINMDGSALYLSIAMVFLAQLHGMSLGLGEIITIGLSCTAASMSSAAVPSAAIVLVIMLCSVVNLPTENVSLLLAVDWLVDRFRTPNNILGDCYTVAIVQHLSQKELGENNNEVRDLENGNAIKVPKSEREVEIGHENPAMTNSE